MFVDFTFLYFKCQIWSWKSLFNHDLGDTAFDYFYKETLFIDFTLKIFFQSFMSYNNLSVVLMSTGLPAQDQ